MTGSNLIETPAVGHGAVPEPRHADADRLMGEVDATRLPPGRWPAARSVPVSVLVPVKNEEANIVECLRHLQWAGEVTVIDSQSKDRTVALSQAMGADVYQFYVSAEGWPKKRNWALANVPWKHEWVLIIDADEHVTPELAEEIRQVVTGAYPRDSDPVKAGSGDGYWLNRKLIFMGRWIKGCGYYPSWNVRLFKHAVGRYERIGTAGNTQSGDNEVHEHVVLSTGPAGYLKHDFLHYAYPDLYSWVEKHNRYTSWEAHTMEGGGGGELKASLFGSPVERRRWIKRWSRRLPFRPTLRFIYGYIIRRGILDGYPGYVICRLMAWYEFMSIAKYRELKRKRMSS
ncbi:MAG: glycosyltransferase family 2 protein [Phycisphaeraceae bacterium]|nr:glycosyltransferase family 2 protein [Phycisphaeraceae bacterium]